MTESEPRSKKEWAIWGANRGFWVHPLRPNSKASALPGGPKNATRDLGKISEWWDENPEYNIGYTTAKFGEEEVPLIVVDVDYKPEKGINGRPAANEMLAEETLNWDCYTQITPSGGSHYFYIAPYPVRRTIGKVAPGIDIISGENNLVGAGSVLEGKMYSGSMKKLVEPAPEKLLAICDRLQEKLQVEMPTSVVDINQWSAEKRSREWMVQWAIQKTPEGKRNQSAFIVGAKCRDFGVNPKNCLGLLLEWTDQVCDPPLSAAEVKTVVNNVFSYAKDPPGSSAPEVVFKEEIKDAPSNEGAGKKHPFDELNEEFAFVALGGKNNILWETTDVQGKRTLERLHESTFHTLHAAKMMQIETKKGVKDVQVTREWMKSAKRRTYKGICFRPGAAPNSVPGYYNLWRGFNVEPAEKGTANHPMVDRFLEHVHENVCNNDASLARWLLGYLAHLIQRPQEKVRTAVVFQGDQGVGKNTVIDCVGHLLGEVYRSVAHPRFLTGNFNAHLENCLAITLNEAFWSGDHGAKGVLKHLVDGKTHMIERKNQEAYETPNLVRVFILSNEKWIIPASSSERRYAVFTVGNKRQGDFKYFDDMRIGMENGGYESLLRYLLDYDISDFNGNAVPVTGGLLNQKLESLSPVESWWFESLQEGNILDSFLSEDSFGSNSGAWPSRFRSRALFDACLSFQKNNGLSRRHHPSFTLFKAGLKKLCPSLQFKAIRVAPTGSNSVVKGCVLPSLEDCRKEWEVYLKQKVEWDSVELDDEG